MRIHTNEMHRADIYIAAEKAGMTLFSLTEHGSRKRKRAFEVKGSGSSTRRTQSDPYEYAATWDEWGIFIQAMFEMDEDAICGQWDGQGQFRYLTVNRFDTLTPDQQHRQHRWEWHLSGPLTCRCGAEMRRA